VGLQYVSTAGLVKGKTIGIDATTLEANAAMRRIVRRDTGESYEEFLTKLARASGIGTPTRSDLARLDRRRKKKGSNDEWMHPHDPDARITKMKDGRTHLARKAEHAIDLETGAIVGVTVQGADQGDTTTIQEMLPEAAEQLEAVAEINEDVKVIEEVVTDKGYHSRTTVTDLKRSKFARISANPIGGASRGSSRPPNATQSTRIGDASAACVGNGFCGDAANCSSDRARICTRARSDAPMSADTRTC
jgi:transposase